MKKRMLVLTLSLFGLITACTSLQPVKMSPVQLQENITTGGIVKVGAQVKVVTTDGKEYEFEVTSISDTDITGKEVSIPIKDIVALEIHETSVVKTSLLSGTLVALVVGFIAVSSFLM